MKTDETTTEEDEDGYDYTYDPYEYEDEDYGVENELVDLISKNTDESTTDITNQSAINDESTTAPETSDGGNDYNYEYDPYEYDYPEEEGA